MQMRGRMVLRLGKQNEHFIRPSREILDACDVTPLECLAAKPMSIREMEKRQYCLAQAPGTRAGFL